MNDRVKFQPDVEPEAEARRQGKDFNRVEGHSALNNSDFIKMCQLLDISLTEREVPKIAEKISYLADWADSQGASGDELKRREIVKNLWRDLGVTYKGEDLVTYLYRYARLDQEEKSIQTEKSFLKPDQSPTEKESEETKEPEKEQQPVESAIQEARRMFLEQSG